MSTMAPMRPMNNDYFYDTASDYDDDDGDDDYYQPSRATSYGYGNTARGRFNNGRRMLSFEYNDDDRSLSGGGGGRKRWTPTIGGVVFFGAIVAGAIVAAIWAKKNVKARLDVSVKRNKGASYSVFTAGSAQVPDNVPVSVYAFSRQVDPSFSPAVVDQLNDRSGGSATGLVNQTYFPAGLNHPAMATTTAAPRGAVDAEGAAQLQRLKQIEALRLQQQQAAAAKRAAAAVAAAGGIPSSTGATSTTTSDVDIVIDEATASHLPRGLPNTSLLDEFVGGMNY